MCFQCYNLEASHIFVTRYAQFDEELFPFSRNNIDRPPSDVISFLEAIDGRPPPSCTPLSPYLSLAPPPAQPLMDDHEPSSSPHVDPPPAPPQLLEDQPPPVVAEQVSSSTHRMTTRIQTGIFKPHIQSIWLPLDYSMPWLHLLILVASNLLPSTPIDYLLCKRKLMRCVLIKLRIWFLVLRTLILLCPNRFSYKVLYL